MLTFTYHEDWHAEAMLALRTYIFSPSRLQVQFLTLVIQQLPVNADVILCNCSLCLASASGWLAGKVSMPVVLGSLASAAVWLRCPRAEVSMDWWRKVECIVDIWLLRAQLSRMLIPLTLLLRRDSA